MNPKIIEALDEYQSEFRSNLASGFAQTIKQMAFAYIRCAMDVKAITYGQFSELQLEINKW